ncbi:MAG: lipoprotein signal peptidase [Gammaproteobacteria bacterium]|nr:lipoprotein signal peptidase [Gammaproteobacteria bacterium]
MLEHTPGPEQDTRSALRWLWLAMLVVILDQASKQWAEAVLPQGQIELVSWFNFTLAYNRGAAFSFLADAGGWQRFFFLGIGLVAVVVITLWLRRLRADETQNAIGLALILGGAIGNLIDRALYGYVVDFVDWHYGDWHWPAFNLADAAILLGAVLVVLAGLRGGKERAA